VQFQLGEATDALGDSCSALVRTEAEATVRAAGMYDWEYPVNYFDARKPSPGILTGPQSNDAAT